MLLKFVLRSASATFKDPPRTTAAPSSLKLKVKTPGTGAGILSLSFPLSLPYILSSRGTFCRTARVSCGEELGTSPPKKKVARWLTEL